MKKIFGTDGVRGLANTQITCELAFNIGKAVAIYATKKCSQIKPKILVVRDTRTSGDMLQCAICAGITSMGIDVVTTEILPTPAVHVLVKKRFSSMGVMITASHNPPEYNGIKIINELGLKLSDEEETEIEQILADISNYLPCDPSDVGVITFNDELPMTFAEYELKSLSENLEGISICLDCANGATYQMAPYIFKRAGAKIDVINDESDGVKINVNCGSTHIEQLSEYIKDKNFNLGFAFDGDGDRMIAVLGDGTVLGGDEMIFLTTYYYADKKILNNNLQKFLILQQNKNINRNINSNNRILTRTIKKMPQKCPSYCAFAQISKKQNLFIRIILKILIPIIQLYYFTIVIFY